MWPRGNHHAQLAVITDRLDALKIALRESRGEGEPALVAIIEQRLEELTQERDRIEAMLPKPRPAAD